MAKGEAGERPLGARRPPQPDPDSLLGKEAEHPSRGRQGRRVLRAQLQGFYRSGDRLLGRLRSCGVVRHGGAGDAALAVNADGEHSTVGLQTCGSPWACPMCSAVIRHERSLEIREVLASHADRGKVAVLVTLTAPTRPGVGLAEAFEIRAKAWQLLTSGRRKGELAGFGVVGTIRSVEVGWNPLSGAWSPHAHVVMLLDRVELGLLEHGRLLLWLRERWRSAVLSAGGEEPSSDHGCRVDYVRPGDVETVGGYLAKIAGSWDVASEISRMDVKRGRGRSLAPLEVAQHAVAGDLMAQSAWLEFVRVTRGRQSITFSAGLRAEYLAGDPRSDEEISDERSRAGLEIIATFEPGVWRQVTRLRLHGLLPGAADRGGLVEVERALRTCGVRFECQAGPGGVALFTVAGAGSPRRSTLR